MIDKIKKVDYRHYICILLTVFFVYLFLTIFSDCIFRLIESCRDFGLSVAYYFCNLFEIDMGFEPTVNNYSNIQSIKDLIFPSTDVPVVPVEPTVPVEPVNPDVIIPDTYDGFVVKWTLFWKLLFTRENLFGYISVLANILLYISYLFTIVLPIVILLVYTMKKKFKKSNNDYNKETRALRVFKCIENRGYKNVVAWFKGFFDFLKNHRLYKVLWVIIWLFNFNIFTIVLEFFAFYFYFVFSFDLIHLYKQVYKLFVDLIPLFSTVPLIVWIILGLRWFNGFRTNIALGRLQHFEMRNRGFINARPIVVMCCGTMGKKKTTMITDMALSQEAMLRDKAFEKILENDLKFPNFSWINLERVIQKAMEKHIVYNLESCKSFIGYLRACFFKYYQCDKAVKKSIFRHLKRDKDNTCNFAFVHYNFLFGYDYEVYGFYYDDKLEVVDVWQVIDTYAQLYFFYIIQSSLIVSNYSIRTDSLLQSIGNFPIWNSDFFNSDSRLIDSYSRHSHILDFDTMRLGRKLVENNEYANSLEFGVRVITEVGKERKNTKELQGVKKDDGTNQNNDLFNYTLKMIRHQATIDKYPFVKIIADEQRPESWCADARDLCDIVHIANTEDTVLAMPFFTLGEIAHSLIFSKITRTYVNFRFNRGDNCLLMYLLKKILTAENNHYKRIYNRFGYCVLNVETEKGTQDGEKDSGKYYLMSKKIYSKRFSTDCFSGFFMNKSSKSKWGIEDIGEYRTEKATLDELKLQNSYFIKDLTSIEDFNDEVS